MSKELIPFDWIEPEYVLEEPTEMSEAVRAALQKEAEMRWARGESHIFRQAAEALVEATAAPRERHPMFNATATYSTNGSPAPSITLEGLKEVIAKMPAPLPPVDMEHCVQCKCELTDITRTPIYFDHRPENSPLPVYFFGPPVCCLCPDCWDIFKRVMAVKP